MKPVLITMGCSWTYGEGSGYVEGMSQEDYTKIQHDPDVCWENGWRKKVVEHFDFDHHNISEYGSSNDRQFRLAKQYFVSNQFKELYLQNRKIYVLWGMTSLNRYDMWVKDQRKYAKIFLNKVEKDLENYAQDQDYLAYALNKYSYQEEPRTRELETEILYWNQYFKLLGIKNFWFDTFASFRYRIRPKNFFDVDKDLRSLVNIITNHHKKRIGFNMRLPIDNFGYAIKHGIVNDISFHPKKEYYSLIGDYFIKKLEENIDVSR